MHTGLSDRLAAALAPADVEGPAGSAVQDRSSRLTERERQVLTLLSKGRTQKEVARDLGVSPMTVRAHVVNCCNKLAAINGLHAVALALRSGAIDD